MTRQTDDATDDEPTVKQTTEAAAVYTIESDDRLRAVQAAKEQFRQDFGRPNPDVRELDTYRDEFEFVVFW